MMGGACGGGAFVERTFEARRECRDCHFIDEGECQVVQGRDVAMECPALQEFIRYEGIKIYGANRRDR